MKLIKEQVFEQAYDKAFNQIRNTIAYEIREHFYSCVWIKLNDEISIKLLDNIISQGEQ